MGRLLAVWALSFVAAILYGIRHDWLLMCWAIAVFLLDVELMRALLHHEEPEEEAKDERRS